MKYVLVNVMVTDFSFLVKNEKKKRVPQNLQLIFYLCNNYTF